MPRIKIRVTAEQPALISRAAALVGEPVPGFVATAGRERASAVLTERTTVPGDWFDRLHASLDCPDDAPKLARAAHSRPNPGDR